jgi:hypothetical protein
MERRADFSDIPNNIGRRPVPEACGSIAGMTSSPNWLQRYREGQRDQVWAELREAGGAVRQPGLMREAQLVCDEMARIPQPGPAARLTSESASATGR